MTIDKLLLKLGIHGVKSNLFRCIPVKITLANLRYNVIIHITLRVVLFSPTTNTQRLTIYKVFFRLQEQFEALYRFADDYMDGLSVYANFR